MSMLQVKHWSVRSAQRVHTVLAEEYASPTGINYRPDLKAVSLISIIKDMDMTVNISKRQLEPTVLSKLRLVF